MYSSLRQVYSDHIFGSMIGDGSCASVERLELVDVQHVNSSTPQIYESKWLFKFAKHYIDILVV